MLKLTWRQAAAWRIRRHRLDRRVPASQMLAVASRLCGVHAQIMSSAELTLWARIENLDRDAVQQALWRDRTLVKTWAMRGTLHLLPASELPLWHAALTTSRRFLRPAAWRKYFGITTDELDRLTEAVAEALEGRLLTREELSKQVSRITRSAASRTHIAESSWGTMLRPAAFAGHLCFGPSQGQRVQFTRPDTWLAEVGHTLAPRPDVQAATAEVTRRFLGAYGPASRQDLARWWHGGGATTTARQWIGDLGDEVIEVDLEGTEAWMLAVHAREIRDCIPGHSVNLLPAFDQYVVGASYHAAHLLPGDLRSRVFRPQGWISPVLLVDGRMLGVWRHTIKGSRVEVAIEPFVELPKWARRGAEREAERLAAFLDGNLSLAWA